MPIASEQPKRPAGGAFGVFLAEKRPEFTKACEGQKATAVSKLASEKWQAVSEKEKAQYQKKYEEKKAQFETDMKAFLDAGGEKTKGVAALRAEKRKAKEAKKKDPNAPKKPAGGGYGVFLAENRAAIVKKLPADHKITDVSKAAGEQWKNLSDAAKKPYQDKFLKKQEEYKAAFAEYKKNLGEDAEEEDDEEDEGEEKEEEERSPPKKARKEEAAPKKAPKKAGKPQAPVIEPDVLKKAQGLGLESSLQNLLGRPEITAKDLPQAKLLDALQKNDGLVNKAKHALLGA